MSFTSTVASCFCCSSGGPPLEATLSAEICVHTAVMSRKLMQHESRSMNGTRFTSASSAFLPPLLVGCGVAPAMSSPSPFRCGVPPLLLRQGGRDPHLVLVGHDQVEHADAGLVDVVDHVLGPPL